MNGSEASKQTLDDRYRRIIKLSRDVFMIAALLALEAFIQEHGRCGELASGVEDDRVWMTCSCGAVLVRLVAFG